MKNTPIQTFIKLQEALDSIKLNEVDNVDRMIVSNFNCPEMVEELVANICHYTEINRRLIPQLAELVAKLNSKMYPTFIKKLLTACSSGLLLRMLFDKGIFRREEIEQKCLTDERLYWFFAPEFGIPNRLLKKKNIFRKIQKKMEEYKKNDWNLYKKVIYDGYEEGTMGYAIKNDDVELFQKLSQRPGFSYDESVEMSPFEQQDSKGQEAVETLPIKNAIALYGAVKIYQFVTNKDGLIIVDDAIIEQIVYGKSNIIFSNTLSGTDKWKEVMGFVNQFHFFYLYENFKDNTHDVTAEDALEAYNYIAFSHLIKRTKNDALPFIHIAARNGMLSVVKYLIESKGEEVDKKATNELTPLHLAAENGFSDMCMYLLDKGADINAKTSGKTAILMSAEKGHECAIALLKRGADAKAKTSSCRNIFHQIATSGNVRLFEAMQKELPDMSIRDKDKTGMTVLHCAVSAGNMEMVKYLIKNSLNANELTYSMQNTLHLAANAGNLGIVSYLIDSGVRVDCQDKSGNTPLHLAVKNNYIDIASLLIEKGANVNAKNSNGQTPIYLVQRKAAPMIDLLLEKGTDVNNQDIKMVTPIRFFANSNNIGFMKKIAKKRPNIDLSDGTITDKDYIEVKFSKITYNAILRIIGGSSENPSGETTDEDPDNDDDVKPEDKKVKKEKDVKPVKKEVKQVDATTVPKSPIKSKNAINRPNEQGMTLLHIAASEGHVEGCKALLDVGADINAVDSKGKTPLHYAVENGHMEVIKLLVERKADLSIKDENGNAAYQLMFDKSLSCLDLLRKHRDINDKDGCRI